MDRGEFPCHETIDYSGDDSDDGGSYQQTGDESHCAGALILLEKEERSSQMMRIMERLGMYDRNKLDMNAAVFDTFGDMIDVQRR